MQGNVRPVSQQTPAKRHQHVSKGANGMFHHPGSFQKNGFKKLCSIPIILFQSNIESPQRQFSKTLAFSRKTSSRPINTLIGPWHLHPRCLLRLHVLIWTLRILHADSPGYQWCRAWSNHQETMSLRWATLSKHIFRLSPRFDQQGFVHGSVTARGAGLLETHLTF